MLDTGSSKSHEHIFDETTYFECRSAGFFPFFSLFNLYFFVVFLCLSFSSKLEDENDDDDDYYNDNDDDENYDDEDRDDDDKDDGK